MKNRRRTRTTYGVYNLIEWHATLQAGKATVRVPFTGGSITTQGVTPATYTTDNAVIQLAIERSREFRSGKIKTVRRTVLDGEIEVRRNPERKREEPAPRHAHEDAAIGVAAEVAAECESAEEAADVTEDVAACMPEADPACVTEERKPAVEVEFSCNDDAKDYLEQTYGVTRSKMRTRADILTQARAHSVDIKFV